MIMKLKTRLKQTRWLIVIGIIYIIYLCLDYFNIPSKWLKLNMSNINPDFNNNTITILLFGIAYFAVDKINTVRSSNQRKTAKDILIRTYDGCMTFPDIFENDANALIHVVKQCDFDKTIQEDGRIRYFQNFPFDYDSMICEFAESGIISNEEFNNYLEVKKCYKDYISMRITFFDQDESVRKPTRSDLIKSINKAKEKLSK